jgi:hypothetical protein
MQGSKYQEAGILGTIIPCFTKERTEDWRGGEEWGVEGRGREGRRRKERREVHALKRVMVCNEQLF